MISRVSSYFATLSRREKLGVIISLCAVFIFIVIQFGILPLFEKKQNLATAVRGKENALREIRKLRDDYLKIENDTVIFGKKYAFRDKNFTLFSFLDEMAEKTGVKQRITYMKPSSIPQKEGNLVLSRVEMKLQGITMKLMTDYLYRIEMSDNEISLKKIAVTRSGDKEKLINVTILAETYHI